MARERGGQLVGGVAKLATTYHDDSAAQIDRITTPQGITTRFRYDANGNLTLTDAPGAQTDNGEGNVRFLAKVRQRL